MSGRLLDISNGKKKQAIQMTLSKNSPKCLIITRKNPKITQVELSKIVGINEKNVRNNIKKLKDMGVLERVGSAKGGHWAVK